MNLQRVCSVFFSPTGTTARVVEAIATGTGLPQTTFEITHLYQPPVLPPFAETDLVIVGSPVYVGRVPRVLHQIFDQLQGQNTPCILVGVYGNRHYDDFLVELEDMLAERGFCPVAGAAFVGEHSFSRQIATDRPNEEDLQLAKRFGAEVLEKLARSSSIPTAPTLPGNRPYGVPYGGAGRQEPFGPVFLDSCSSCGICIKKCPSGALPRPHQVEAAKCIRCCACVRSCPSYSIKFVNEQFLHHTRYLEETCTQQKGPALFI